MDERNDEIMCEMRERQAEVRAIKERFKGDPEGYRRFMDAELAKLGFGWAPAGEDGANRLVRIDG